MKLSPYGTAVSAAAKAKADEARAKLTDGHPGHLQGPHQGQHRQGGRARGHGADPDRHRAREDGLPGRGRRRQAPVLTRSGEPPVVRLCAIVVSLLLFGGFVAAAGANSGEVYYQMYRGAFGTWFSFQNTLQRAAPLMLTALCTALPARFGLVVIGGEGALVLGGLGAVLAAAGPGSAPPGGGAGGDGPGRAAGGRRSGSPSPAPCAPSAGSTRPSAACCSTTSPSPLFNHLVEGALRDPGQPQQALHPPHRRGQRAGDHPRDGRPLGAGASGWWPAWRPTSSCTGRASGSPPGWWEATCGRRCCPGCGCPAWSSSAASWRAACAGLAGMVEVAAVHGTANASLIAGYGYSGVLVAFVARHNPLAIIPVSLLLGGIGASGGLLQRTRGPARRRRQRPARDRLRRHPRQRDAGDAGGRRALAPRADGRAAAQPWRQPAAERAADDGHRGRPRPAGRAPRRAGRRPARQHPVPLRQPGRMPHREERAGQPGPGGDAGDGGHVRLRRLLRQRLALAGRAGGRPGGRRLRRPARLPLRPTAGQRHRRGHRPHVAGDRPGVFPGQAAHQADRPPAARPAPGELERPAPGARRPCR